MEKSTPKKRRVPYRRNEYPSSSSTKNGSMAEDALRFNGIRKQKSPTVEMLDIKGKSDKALSYTIAFRKSRHNSPNRKTSRSGSPDNKNPCLRF